MPKILTETPEFSAPITVKLGTDTMDTHAEDIEHIAQSLANRSLFITENMAWNSQPNVFEDTNDFNAATAFNAAAAFNTSPTFNVRAHFNPALPNESSINIRRVAGNDFQECISFDAGAAAANVRFYSGINSDVQGAVFITVNARWIPGSGWEQVDTAKPSTALIIRNQDMRVVSKPAGTTTPWSSWQQSTLSAFDSELLAEVVRVSRALATANTAADYANGFRHISPQPRTSPIPLGLCWGNVELNSDGHVRRRATITGEPDQVWFPIPIPPFSTFGQVHVQFHQLQASQPDQFQLFRRQHAGGWSAQGAVETHSSYGVVTANLHTSGAQVVLDSDEWAYRWKVVSGDGAAIENRIIGLSVDWTDIGPNNRVG